MSAPLLELVLAHYRTSSDFNGLRIDGTSPEICRSAADLIRDGLIEVVSEDDFPNPSVRPWPSRRTAEDQAESVLALHGTDSAVCLYPTSKALAEHPHDTPYEGEPFRRAMAEGRGALELEFFSLDVLEHYRNDPRFSFIFSDFGAKAVIGDDEYHDDDEPEHDKILMAHIGFAYDLTNYAPDADDSFIVRRVCAFYGDLAKLSPIHQQRWSTFRVASDEEPFAHPVWWAWQMGHWPNGIGPFDKLFAELKSLNQLSKAVSGEPLFRTADRPPEFGWILRASQHEWDRFVLEFDKLLSDNLNSKALDALGAAKRDEKGNPVGTLNRLQAGLIARGYSPDAAIELMKPLREVRKARQKPAHAISANISDKNFVHRQVELLHDVNCSLEALRRFWQTHPANEEWDEPEHLKEGATVYPF